MKSLTYAVFMLALLTSCTSKTVTDNSNEKEDQTQEEAKVKQDFTFWYNTALVDPFYYDQNIEHKHMLLIDTARFEDGDGGFYTLLTYQNPDADDLDYLRQRIEFRHNNRRIRMDDDDGGFSSFVIDPQEKSKETIFKLCEVIPMGPGCQAFLLGGDNRPCPNRLLIYIVQGDSVALIYNRIKEILDCGQDTLYTKADYDEYFASDSVGDSIDVTPCSKIIFTPDNIQEYWEDGSSNLLFKRGTAPDSCKSYVQPDNKRTYRQRIK